MIDDVVSSGFYIEGVDISREGMFECICRWIESESVVCGCVDDDVECCCCGFVIFRVVGVLLCFDCMYRIFRYVVENIYRVTIIVVFYFIFDYFRGVLMVDVFC